MSDIISSPGSAQKCPQNSAVSSPWGTWMLEETESSVCSEEAVEPRAVSSPCASSWEDLSASAAKGTEDGYSTPRSQTPALSQSRARQSSYGGAGLEAGVICGKSAASSLPLSQTQALQPPPTTSPRHRNSPGVSTAGETPLSPPASASSWKQAVLLNAPHILLETINARTAGIVILATYLFFLICMVIDFNTTFTTFYGSNNDFSLGSRLCSVTNNTLTTSGNWGCWRSVKSWHGKVDNLSNVLLVTLSVKQRNVSITANSGNSTSDPYMYYNVDLYGCFQSSGCGNKFDQTKGLGRNVAKSWQKVLSKSGYGQNLLESSPTITPGSAQKNPTAGYTFFSIFQNQESLPTNGLVKSYYAKVDFLFEQMAFLPSDYPGSNPNSQLPDPSVFTLSVAKRPPSLGYNVATIFLFIATVFILLLYIFIMRRKARNEWLQEQKWIVAYLVCLIMYQNPLYIIVNFHASPGGALAAYFFGDLAQASFLVLWLCLADSIHAQEVSLSNFYGPKILIGMAIFLSNMIVLSFQFPSFSPAASSGRSPVEAVYNWKSNDRLLFIGASLTFLLLFWVWALIWFVTIYLSKRKLGTLPYMSTRYLQLSFRFFSIQATLVTIYYILQYAATIYFIGVNQPFKQNTTTLTDNINTLFRQQTQLFGKTMFLTVYAAILAFLFLPADFMESDLANSLAVNFALSEREQETLVRKRKRTIKRLESLVLMNQVVQVNPHVFCVNLALNLLEVAYEAYNESAENQRHALLVRQKSMSANLSTFGFVVVEIVENKELDILFLVARHLESNRLVFAFRGTRSTKNMGNNLNYAQKDIEINSLPNPKNVLPLGPAAGAVGTEQPLADDDLESDGSTNEDEDRASEGRSVRGCGDFTFVEATARCLRDTLRCATTNALQMGGEMVSSAAAVTPGLNQFIKTSVHSGFWKAYEAVRDDIHRIVHKEFRSNSAHLCFTGHSLGGALATLACWDITINALPRINNYWRLKRIDEPQHAKHKKIVGTMYNFGSPRVGNRHFASEYNKQCPNSFRVVVDGDFITSIPKTGFIHVGTEVVIDSNAAGTIIVDPSFVEQWLRSKVKNSLMVHLMTYYRNGLEAVKQATEFLRQHVRDGERKASNIIRLALIATPRARLDSDSKSVGAAPTISFPPGPSSSSSTPVATTTASSAGGGARSSPISIEGDVEMTLNPLSSNAKKQDLHLVQPSSTNSPLMLTRRSINVTVNPDALTPRVRRNSAASYVNDGVQTAKL